MTRHIIIPVDGSPLSERAVPYGLVLARALRAQVELVTVVTPPQLLEIASQRRMTDLAGATRYLEQLAARAVPNSQPVMKVLEGDAAAALLQYVALKPNALVVMSTHGRGGVGRVVHGSVADKLVRLSPTPVALIPPQAPAAPDPLVTLVAPLDGSTVAESVTPLVIELATATGASVILVEAVVPFLQSSAAAYASWIGPIDGDQITEIDDQLVADAREYLRAVQRRLHARRVAVTTEVRLGRPGTVILDEAEATRGRWLVLASHGRGGLQRLALGSVAGELAQRATVPVIVAPVSASTRARNLATHSVTMGDRSESLLAGEESFIQEPAHTVRLDQLVTVGKVARPHRNDPQSGDRSVPPGHNDVPAGGTTGGRASSGGGAGSQRRP